MKKLLILLFAVAVGFTACKKDESSALKDVQISIGQVDYPSASREDVADVPECSDLVPEYAKFVIDGDTITSDVYYIEDVLYTKTFKEDIGVHTVTMFELYNGETLIKAAPLPGSEYQDYVTNKLNITFEVAAFDKIKVEVDVLCFEPAYYDEFGYYWFQVNQFTVYETCTFGDFCIKSPEHYIGSLYEESGNGVEVDEPAIFKLTVDGETFSNEDWLGVGAPLCFKYAEEDGVVGHHTAVLSLYAATGDTFGYVDIYTFEWDGIFEDTYDSGDDGVFEFVVGNCVDYADKILAPYVNLPEGEFTMTLGSVYGPGTYHKYVDVDLEGFGEGYDLLTGWQGVWCADLDTHINLGQTYTVTAVSSLNPPEDFTRLSTLQLQKLNYFFNALPALTGEYGNFDYDNPGSYWSVIQDVVWYITNGTSVSGDAAVYAADVDTNGDGYMPLPGGYAAIIFDAGENVQILFVTVDP